MDNEIKVESTRHGNIVTTTDNGSSIVDVVLTVTKVHQVMIGCVILNVLIM